MKQIQLSIPTPCHENWNNMTASEKGRYCAACSKVVVDFTNMSDAELLNYFSALTTEKVCGRLEQDQLDRMISKPRQVKNKLYWYWQYIVMFFLFIGKGNTSKAQLCYKTVTSTQLDSVRNVNINYAVGQPVLSNSTNNNKVIISGTIKDSSGNPLPFVSIKIINGHVGCYSDAAGKYSIRADVDHDTLLIAASGYKPQQFELRQSSDYNFILQGTGVLNEVLVGLVGGIVFRDADGLPEPPVQQRHLAVLEIKDADNGKPISNASLLITNIKSAKRSQVLTDSKGVFKIKNIDEYDSYLITVAKDGYQSYDFEVKLADKGRRKFYQEVMLRKSETIIPAKKPSRIIMGGVSSLNYDTTHLIYVLDGVVLPKGLPQDFDFTTVAEVSLLQKPAAMALFGQEGSGGAMIITTNKKNNLIINQKEKINPPATGQIKQADSPMTVAEKQSQLVHVFPNPVVKGNAINVLVQAKSSGTVRLMVMDASGTAVMNTSFTTTAGSNTMQLKTDIAWANGIYFVRVIDNKQQVIGVNAFLIQ